MKGKSVHGRAVASHGGEIIILNCLKRLKAITAAPSRVDSHCAQFSIVCTPTFSFQRAARHTQIVHSHVTV